MILRPQLNDATRSLLRVLNQVFELERKLARLPEGESAQRHVRKLKELFEEDFRLTYEDPTGQTFSETRTDVEARLAGDSAEDLIIVETHKPIIRHTEGLHSLIVQKGVVVAEPRSTSQNPPPK